jgi:hypothetical protein
MCTAPIKSTLSTEKIVINSTQDHLSHHSI